MDEVLVPTKDDGGFPEMKIIAAVNVGVDARDTLRLSGEGIAEDKKRQQRWHNNAHVWCNPFQNFKIANRISTLYSTAGLPGWMASSSPDRFQP